MNRTTVGNMPIHNDVELSRTDNISEARRFISLIRKLNEQEKFGVLLMIQGAKLLAEK